MAVKIPNQPNNVRSAFGYLILVTLVVVLVRWVVSLTDPSLVLVGDDFAADRYLEIARHVVSGEGYSLSPYGQSDGLRPTAVRGPMGVYFFAAIIYMFGNNPWWIIVAQWLIDAGTAVVLFLIAIEIFQDRRVAVVASLLFAFYLPGLVFTFAAWSEPLFALLLAGSTFSLLRALRGRSTWWYALSAALLGLAMMTRPVVQFYPLVMVILLAWALDRQWSRIIPKVSVFLVAFAAVLSPWVIRNYLVFNTFIPGSSWSGPPFYEGNFALDQPDYLRQRSSGESGVALRKALEARFGSVNVPDNGSYYNAIGVNEVEFDRIAFQEGLKLVHAHPGRYISLSIVRFFRLWFHHRFVNFVIMGGKLPKAWLVGVMNGALLGLAAAAFIWFRGQWLRQATLLIVLIAYNSAVYAATNAVGRYSVPIMPYVMLFAAFTIVQLIQRWGTQSAAIKVAQDLYARQEAKA
jgi:4-amino-4-deoxy-L-arabinose transferase-like glycosyltransferase